MPYLKGEVKENPRKGFLYWSDEGDLMALRYGNWKVHFMEQRAKGSTSGRSRSRRCGSRSSSTCAPIRSRKRTYPADVYYWKWRADRVFMLVPAGALVAQYMQTMMEFPPRQSPESWTPEP